MIPNNKHPSTMSKKASKKTAAKKAAAPAATPSVSLPQLVVTASSLNVRRSPSLTATVTGSLSSGTVVDWLETSPDELWAKVRHGTLSGWSSRRYLAETQAPAPGGPYDEILRIADTSAIAQYRWLDRGRAPRAYIRGMALAFARVYCKLSAGDPAAMEMAKANTGVADVDALAHYAQIFHEAGMNNESSGASTLRHLYVLLVGLGMRESSGKHCEGRDTTAGNVTAETAEAGLFQTSWNARIRPDMTTIQPMVQVFNHYRANPQGFLEIFQEGVTCSPQNWHNHGTGLGRTFQQLSKECPAFAAEFAAVGLRNRRRHWGPVNRREAEVRPECNTMLLRVQQAVDSLQLCPV